ncbi:unnamed protein product [Amoebophrya sp. A120]|nr:unnamed protein product [Amoebophrya sp. A120]|eukprot:GSA120T00018997001.1
MPSPNRKKQKTDSAKNASSSGAKKSTWDKDKTAADGAGAAGSAASTSSRPAEDPFAKLFLASVRRAMEQPKSHASCVALLQLASPDFEAGEFTREVPRSRALRALKQRLAPSKHADESEASALCQGLDDFVSACLAAPKKSSVGASEAGEQERDRASARHNDEGADAGSNLPMSFNLFENYAKIKLGDSSSWMSLWKYKKFVRREGALQSKGEVLGVVSEATSSLEHSACLMAINWSAHIVCGKEPGKWLSSAMEEITNHKVLTTAKDMSINDIKRLIMKVGPVVSTSFSLTKELVRACAANTFREDFVGKKHPVVVAGWQYSSHGTSWLVKPLGPSDVAPVHYSKKGDKASTHYDKHYDNAGNQFIRQEITEGVSLLPVGTKSFGIEDEIKYCKPDSLIDKKFHNGSYLGFDKKLSAVDAEAWPTRTKFVWDNIKPAGLSKLFSAFQAENLQTEVGIVGVSTRGNKTRIVELHPPGQRARSRKAKIVDLIYDKDKNVYTATFLFAA